MAVCGADHVLNWCCGAGESTLEYGFSNCFPDFAGDWGAVHDDSHIFLWIPPFKSLEG